MERKHIALIFGLFALLTAEVVAAGQKSGLYIGGSLGSAALDFSKEDVEFDDNDFAYKLFTGINLGIIPMIDLGVEGSYVDFGKASSKEIFNQEVGVTGWDLFGVGAVNMGPVAVFGKVGHIWWSSKSKSKSDALKDILDETGYDMAYGIGVRFQFDALAIRAEYELFDIEDVDVKFLSAGISLTF